MKPPKIETPTEWSDEFALGFGPMDATHQDFLELVLELSRADKDAAGPVLERLIEHTTGHFETEDRWMEQTAFPAFACHRDEHAAVMTSMKAVLQRLKDGDATPVASLAAALPTQRGKQTGVPLCQTAQRAHQ